MGLDGGDLQPAHEAFRRLAAALDAEADHAAGAVRQVLLSIAPNPHDKGEAIDIVLDKLKISKDHAMAIGDDIVDISMFNHVRYGVAMGNGKQEVVDNATHVAKHIQEHGVKEILKDLVLK